ncbi:MAG TPA: tripartite tricarboxylate transporter substrate binding protein BugE [Noviherbaspirillum sp.]|jgi:tripartite-type tricarboxylate transporter receptor subunit TctC|uniref:tripartite tricarboxylate transporter substrate binding protein BugE n=1 Tax=Noviherbaspirillum sp. TaxID=1926288 RepID=UPI002DDDAF5D|nr:tripartite tricarboxylate transporter substrate binding protein BugE [Noviherbaspirillum sp.]HEV2611723.1 tripartite tricarboxylate transporter substrate binding protein BugE [Noviherbaspirillum sp.]
MKSRKLLLTITFAAGAAAMASAQAQNFPTKPIRLIVPFAPGGTTDIVARVVGDKLGKELGQPVVIENRGGGGGSIGASAISKAEPDGYTIGVSTVSTHAVNAACNSKLGYDPIKDFTPITNMARTPNVLTVNPKFPAQDFKQFLAEVKKNPGKLNYATSGTCSIQHMVGEQFKASTGTFILHIPYRGAGPALNDLLGGQVDMMFDNLPSSMSHIQSNKLRPLAIAWHKRLEALPNVPTFAELGLKQVNDPAWYGLVAPPKTPDDIVKKINAAAVKVLNMPDVKERLMASGAEPVGNTPAEHAAEIKAELEKMKNLVNKQGIKLDGA